MDVQEHRTPSGHFDLWPPESNQLVLDSTWTFVLNLWKVLQGVLRFTRMGQADDLKTERFRSQPSQTWIWFPTFKCRYNFIIYKICILSRIVFLCFKSTLCVSLPFSSPDVIGPQGNLQLSQDLRGFLDTSLKLAEHMQETGQVSEHAETKGVHLCRPQGVSTNWYWDQFVSWKTSAAAEDTFMAVLVFVSCRSVKYEWKCG